MTSSFGGVTTAGSANSYAKSSPDLNRANALFQPATGHGHRATSHNREVHILVMSRCALKKKLALLYHRVRRSPGGDDPDAAGDVPGP